MDEEFIKELEGKLREVFQINRLEYRKSDQEIISNPLTFMFTELGGKAGIVKVKKYHDRVVPTPKTLSGKNELNIVEALKSYANRLKIPEIYNVKTFSFKGKNFMAIYMEKCGKTLEELIDLNQKEKKSIELFEKAVKTVLEANKELTSLYNQKHFNKISEYNKNAILEYMERDLIAFRELRRKLLSRNGIIKVSIEKKVDDWFIKYGEKFKNWFNQIADQIGICNNVVFFDSLPKNIFIEPNDDYKVKIGDFIKIGLSNNEISLARLIFSSYKISNLSRERARDILNKLNKYAIDKLKEIKSGEYEEMNIYSRLAYATQYVTFANIGILAWYIAKSIEEGRINLKNNEDKKLIKNSVELINQRIDFLKKLYDITGWDMLKLSDEICEGLDKLKINY